MQLTSVKNPLLQKIRRAAASGRPTEDGLVVIEGPHLVAEALRSGWALHHTLTTPEGRERYAGLLEQSSAEVIEIPARAFASTASTETAQEILALVRPRPCHWQDLASPHALVVVLDGVQDPGNAGTIVRSAEAFGAGGIVFLEGSVRVANGKFLRAAAGSIFRLPFLETIERAEFVKRARSLGLTLYALAARGETALQGTDLRIPCALVVGGEASGVSPELLAAATALSIPVQKVESLNAAVAASIALFEAARQRERA